MSDNHKQLLDQIIAASKLAGDAIMTIYADRKSVV